MFYNKLLFLSFTLITFTACISTSSSTNDIVPLPDAVTISISRYDNDENSVTISWTASVDEHFLSYKIYRSDSIGVNENSTLLATITNISTISYEDSFEAKPTGYYYYRVYVENKGGTTGSNEVIIIGLYILQLSFGTCGNGDGEFSSPSDVAADNNGNVYVTDSALSRIQKFDSDGNYISQWGEAGIYEGEFSFPYSIEFASDGKLYVGDNNNDRVQIFAADNTYFGKVDVNAPGDSTISSSGEIYAASFTDNVIKTFNSSLTPGNDIGEPGSGDGQFINLWDVALSSDGTKLYALDNGTGRIEIFQTDGTYVDKFAGAGTDPGECDDCWGLAVDNYDYVYVTDWDEGMVQIYNNLGIFQEEFQIPAGDTAYGIWNLDFDNDNNMYVVDAPNCAVYKYGP